MDRNTITGLVLIALILITSTFLLKSPPPLEPEANKTTTHADTGNRNQQKAAVSTQLADSLVAANLPGDWAGFARGENKTVNLENKDLKMQVSSKGGRVTYVELKNYKTAEGKPLVLLTESTSQYGYQFSTGKTTVNTKDLYFNAENVTDTSVTMVVALANGKAIKQYYAIKPQGFLADHKLQFIGLNDVIPSSNKQIQLNWESQLLKNEHDSTIASQNSTVHYRQKDGEHDFLSETSDEQEQFQVPMHWVSFKQQFFCQSLVTSDKPFVAADLSTKVSGDSRFLKDMHAKLSLPYNHEPDALYNMQFYFGPLHYQTLKKFDLELERQIPLGWSFFLTSWVNRFIIIPAFNFLSQFIGNYGIIILLLTIYIKLIILPLTYKSYLSTAKMRLLKPELDELKAKYGDDMVQMQQEQMKLYRKAGVSPFGGCIPLLLQFPILIAMFRFFPASIELRQESFLWAHDLSTYDSIFDLPFNIPFYGSHVSLFTLLMTASTLIQTRLNNSMTPQQPEMKMMGYLMPIFFLGFFNSYAAGLSLYYFYFNMLTFLQQYLFKLFINDKKLHEKIEANKKRPVSAKKGGLQKRLEDIANKQKELQKNKAPKPPRRK